MLFITCFYLNRHIYWLIKMHTSQLKYLLHLSDPYFMFLVSYLANNLYIVYLKYFLPVNVPLLIEHNEEVLTSCQRGRFYS